MKNKVAIAGRGPWRGEADAKPARKLTAGRLDIYQGYPSVGQLGAQPRDQRADNTRAHHGDMVGGRGLRIPHCIQCRFHIGAENGACGRHWIWYRRDRGGGHVENALMGIKRKNDTALQRGRPALDQTNGRIPVFDGKRERSNHERRAHAPEFGRGNTPGQHQSFGAPANAAVQSANLHLAWSGLEKRLRPDFGTACSGIPQGFSGSARHFFWSQPWTLYPPSGVYPEQ
jgi:hypothetical protein